MKKLLSFCAALALLLPTPALAAGNTATVFEAQCMLPAIDVVIPATQKIFINPYELSVTIDSDETTAQIVYNPACIENKSEVPLSVNVSLVGTIKEGSDMTLTDISTGGTGARKQAFIYFEIHATNSDDPPDSIWDSGYNVARHLVLTTGTETRESMVTLDAAGGANCFGAFRLTGDCAAQPTVGWTDADGVDTAIMFTFMPLPRQES